MNHSRWKHLIDANLCAMDFRHVQMIHAMLINEQPSSVVEIGVYNGFSSSAIVEAIEDGCPIKELVFVDSNIRPEFTAFILNPIMDNSIFPTLLQQDSSSINLQSECWIIDGDHKEGALLDYEHARNGGAQIIVAHDTNPNYAAHNQWGAIDIGRRMQNDAVMTFSDFKHRERENTERGLSISFYRHPRPETLTALKELL